MDLEALPPEPDESGDVWTTPAGTAVVEPARRRWSTRARIAASVGAVGIAGAAAFGIGQVAAAGSGGAAATTTPTTTPARVHRGAALGKVSDLKGPDFTVTGMANATTRTTAVVTDASTVFTKTQKGAVSDIKAGQVITAMGTRAADGSLTASRITVAPAGAKTGPKPGPKTGADGQAPKTRPAPPAGVTPPGGSMQQPPFATGTVQSNTNGVITLTSPRGTQKVTTSSTTVVVETVKAALSDVTNGATVAVGGTPTADGSHLTAQRVDIIDPTLVGQGGGGFGGFGPGGPGGGHGRGPGGPGGRGGRFMFPGGPGAIPLPAQ